MPIVQNMVVKTTKHCGIVRFDQLVENSLSDEKKAFGGCSGDTYTKCISHGTMSANKHGNTSIRISSYSEFLYITNQFSRVHVKMTVILMLSVSRRELGHAYHEPIG